MTMNRDAEVPHQQQHGTSSSSVSSSAAAAAAAKATAAAAPPAAAAAAADDANRPPPSLCLSNQLNPNNSWYNARLAAKYKTMTKEEKDQLWLMDLTKRLQAGRGSSGSGSRRQIDDMTAVTPTGTETGGASSMGGPSGNAEPSWPAQPPPPPPPPPPLRKQISVSSRQESTSTALATAPTHSADTNMSRGSNTSSAANLPPTESSTSHAMHSEPLVVIGSAPASASTNLYTGSSLAGPSQQASSSLGGTVTGGSPTDAGGAQHSGSLGALFERQPGTSTSGMSSQQLQDKLTVLQWWMATGEQLPVDELYRWSAIMQRVVCLPSEVRSSLLELLLQASLVEPGLLVNTMATTRPGSALAQDYVPQDSTNQTFIPMQPTWPAVSMGLAPLQQPSEPGEAMGVLSSGSHALYHTLKNTISPARNPRTSWAGTIPLMPQQVQVPSMVVPQAQRVGTAQQVLSGASSMHRTPALARMQSSPSLAVAVQAGSSSSGSSLAQPSTAELAYQAYLQAAPSQLHTSNCIGGSSNRAGAQNANLDAAAMLNRVLAANVSMSGPVHSASTFDSTEMSISGHLSGSWALHQRQHQQQVQLQQLHQLQQQQQHRQGQQAARRGSQRVKRNSWEEEVAAIGGWVGDMYLYEK